ncbi:MAG: alkaline phosphatase family protein [Ignavibacteriae bacterium]|nr:alkaline phosphatase family protein [Ignavibacteriota bacterium]
MKNTGFAKFTLVFLPLFLALFLSLQFIPGKKKEPKLVVGIVIDQMTYEFIPRYWDKFSDGGFKRLINQGYFCRNTGLEHFPSYTAVGHACIYTGAIPSVNGICANDWYDREKNKIVYCADDDSCHTVGSFSDDGKMSPRSMLTSTITDELVKKNKNSKVIGIALKDRGAIFPAGHLGTAYWFDPSSKNFVTSTYYMNKLPEWVEKFNGKYLPDFYLSSEWKTLLPIEQYTESTEDDNPYEDIFRGEDKPVFPHNLPELINKNKNLLRSTPFGNSITKDFAIDAITNENLGRNEATDFLCVSFSSTDYVGHKFGPNSIEVEDTYLRVDRDIEDLLRYLDNFTGQDNYLVFLTADHGVCGNPGYLNSKGIPSGVFYTKAILDSVNVSLERKYKVKNLAYHFFNQQITLDYKLIEQNKLNLNEITEYTADYIKNNVAGVENVCTKYDLMNKNSDEYYFRFFKNGFYEKRCGDVFVNFKKYWVEDRIKGAEHGGPYDYDIHIPLIWYGCGIKKGETNNPVSQADIAPTLSVLLNIGFPSGCTGKPIKEITGN